MVKIRPRAGKNWVRWLLVLGVMATGAPALGAWVAGMPAVRAYAAREASAALRRELGLDAAIGDVRLEVSPVAVVASDIHLDHPKYGPFAEVATLRIRPSLRGLLHGRIDLRDVTVETATVWLTVRDGRIQNLPELPELGDKSDAPSLPFDELHVERSRLVLDAQPQASAEVRNIEVQLTRERQGAVRAAISADGGFVRHGNGWDALSHLAFLGTYSPKALALELVRLQTPELKLDVRDAEVGLPLGTHYRGHVELGLQLAQALTWPHGLSLPDMEGELDIKSDLEGDAKGPRGRAQVRVDRGRVKQFGLGRRVALDVRFDPALVLFNGFSEIAHEGGTVALLGRVGLSAKVPLSIQATVQDVAFAKLMDQLGVSPNAIVDWNLRGGFTLTGTAAPFELGGPLRMATRDFKVLRHAWHAKGPERRILGVRSAKLAGKLLVRGDGIHFDDVDIELPDSKLKATTVLGFDNQLHVRAQGLDWNLADASPLVDLPLAGRGRFDVEVNGSFSHPTINGHLRAANFSLNTFDFGDIETDLHVDYDLEGVHFSDIVATKNDSRYVVQQGLLDFRKSGFRAGGQINVQRLSLADFYRIFHWDGDERYEPYQALANGKAKLSYSLGFPHDSAHGSLSIEMDLNLPEANLDGYAFRDGHFAGSWKWLDPNKGYQGGQLAVERLSLHKGTGTLNVSGRMGLKGALDFVVVGDKIAVRETEPLHAHLPSLNGTLAMTGTVKGIASKPRVDLEVAGTGLTLGAESLGETRMFVRLTDKSDPWVAQALQWPEHQPPAGAACGHAREGMARGQWPEDPPMRTNDGPQPHLEQPMAWLLCGSALQGQLRVDLALGRTQQYPLRGRIGFERFDFGRLLPQLRPGTVMRGITSGALTLWDGAVLTPESLTGQLSLQELHVGPFGLELRSKGPVDVAVEHGNFQIRNARFEGPRTQLAIAGGASFTSGLGMRIDGALDLGLLPALSQRVAEARGKLTLSVKLTGPMDDPAVYGEAWIRDSALSLNGFPKPVRELQGKVTFSARRVLLEGFSAAIAGGTLRASGSGELALHGLSNYALQLEAEGLKLDPRDGVELRVGGQGELSWKRGDALPLLHGKLMLDKFAYTRPIKMDPTLIEIATPERRQSAGYDPTLDRLRIDLEVTHANPLVVRNNLIDAELRLETARPPFRLVGTDQQIGLLGNISVTKGTIHFRERNFEIRQGDIRFDDETRIDPQFDLRAATDVRRKTDQGDWRVEVHAYGNRDRFQFDLSSEPYLAQDDVVLLLAVGMTHAELAQLQTSDLTSTAALEALATFTGVGNQVHRALPQIDDFHVAAGYSERTKRTETQLVIGKRLAKNVRLSAATGIAEARDFRTGLELELNDKTSLQAVYDNQNTTASQIGDVGVDVKWRLEFD